MQSILQHRVVLAGLCVVLAGSIAVGQTTRPASATKPKSVPAALKSQTTPVKSTTSGLRAPAQPTAKKPAAAHAPIASRKPVVEAPPGTIPNNLPGGVTSGAGVDPELSSPAGALTGTIDDDAIPDLGDDFEYVPMPGGGGGVKKRVEGGYTHTTYKRTESSQPPAPVLNIQESKPEPEPRTWPKVWAVAANANISPTTGNMLSDGFLQYDRGPQRISHRIGNEVWNANDKKVRLSVDENRGVKFQVVAELQGRQRRLVLKADNLIGPRPLPADKCVTVSRVWYTRGKHGREPDSWWDSPHTLVPIFKPLLVPSEDNPVPGQTNQAFVVTIYIPKLVLSGVYRTTLHVTDLDDPTYYDNIQIEVSAQPDGKKMRSVIG